MPGDRLQGTDRRVRDAGPGRQNQGSDPPRSDGGGHPYRRAGVWDAHPGGGRARKDQGRNHDGRRTGPHPRSQRVRGGQLSGVRPAPQFGVPVLSVLPGGAAPCLCQLRAGAPLGVAGLRALRSGVRLRSMGRSHAIAGRHAARPAEIWNLQDLLRDPAHDLDVLRQELEEQVRRFEGFRDRLAPEIPAETFLDALKLAEAITRTMSRLGAYAYLWFSENTKNQKARAFKAAVEEMQAGFANRMLFFDLWWQKLDDASAGRLLAGAGDYAYHLDSLRRFKDHALSEPEEKIINVKSVTGRRALVGLYDILTNGLTYTLTVNGKARTLTREDLLVYVRDPDARIREDAYRAFSPRLAELAGRVLEERHVDVAVRPGKLSGAYCYSVIPGLTPYVLLNFKGDVRDVATLAHELGHAVHGMLAAEHSIFTFHAMLPLAETASVFGERLLSDAWMAEERDKVVKQSLLIRQLDDAYATILRQAYFVRFEREAHRIIGAGGTMDDLCGTYLSELRQQFGRAVAVPDEFRWEWLSIPHLFASPFYCYAYSFGNLLVLALYALYRTHGESFVLRYLALLAAGGSRSPEALLKDFGVDIRSESFWQAGFETIKGMIRELEKTA